MRHRLPPFVAKRKENEQWISNCLLSQKGDLTVPSDFHELTDLSLDKRKPEPELQETVLSEWYTPDSSLIDESYKKDLAWILGRLHEQQPELQSIPGWTSFNQLLATEKPQVTVVGPLPIVNAVLGRSSSRTSTPSTHWPDQVC